MEESKPTQTSRQYLKELQADVNCPEFKDLSVIKQRLLANEVVSRLGFGTDHISYWLDGRYPTIEIDILSIALSKGGLPSLLLSGSVGTGKTAFMSILLKERFIYWANKASGKAYVLPALFATKCFFITHQELVDVSLAEFKEESDFSYSIQDLKDAGILIIDDLCNTKESEYNLTKLDDIINHRWANKKTTWMTTNISGEDLKTRQGYQRIYSRLSDSAWVVYAEISETDRRSEN